MGISLVRVVLDVTLWLLLGGYCGIVVLWLILGGCCELVATIDVVDCWCLQLFRS